MSGLNRLLASSTILAFGLAACSLAAPSVTVEWTTATEVNTAGFNLYRGDSSNGPFTQVNPALIPASPDPLTGGNYQYQDKGVLAGRTYYYQLEDVDLSGAATRHGPLTITAPGAAEAAVIPALAVTLGALAFAIMALARARGRKRRAPRETRVARAERA